MANKRYYWLKLKENFFTQPKIKKLRKLENGDQCTIVYLKIQLLSLRNEGKLYFEGLEDDFPAEIALSIDENYEIVKCTIDYLLKYGLMVEGDGYELTETKQSIGGETESTVRSRKCRSKKKEQSALQCNNNATQSNTSDAKCNTDIDIEKEKDKSIEEDCKKEQAKPARKRFVKPSLEELKAFNEEKQLNVDCDRFMDYYEANGWKAGKNPMKDWKAAMRNWSRNDRDRKKEKEVPSYDLPII